MSNSQQPKLPGGYTRADLRWAEVLLGESLQPLPAKTLDYTPTGDASVIPMGEYCYDTEADGPASCPHFCETGYGTVKCSYVNVEAYDPHCVPEEQMIKHFGSLEKAQAAGVIPNFLLADECKICDTNLQPPGRAKWLESLIGEYREKIEAQPVIDGPTAEVPDWDFTEMTQWMIGVAWRRLELWEYLTSMVEDVPPELIQQLMVADKRFRVKTFPSSELMDPDFANHMPPHEQPTRQYWYVYRKNLGNPLPHEALHDPISFYPPVRPQGK